MTSKENPLFLTVQVKDRHALHRIVEEYSSMDDEVETITIVDPSEDDPRALNIDVGHITDKQWEALEVANELGHYQTPRGGGLQEIADELDITKSAVSQRLRAAEAKIVSAILGKGEIRGIEAQ